MSVGTMVTASYTAHVGVNTRPCIRCSMLSAEFELRGFSAYVNRVLYAQYMIHRYDVVAHVNHWSSFIFRKQPRGGNIGRSNSQRDYGNWIKEIKKHWKNEKLGEGVELSTWAQWQSFTVNHNDVCNSYEIVDNIVEAYWFKIKNVPLKIPEFQVDLKVK